MKFTNCKRSNVTKYVNFDAVRFLWIEDMGENFCKRNRLEDRRYSVVAEHDIYLASFATEAEAEKYLAALVAKLNKEDTHEQQT